MSTKKFHKSTDSIIDTNFPKPSSSNNALNTLAYTVLKEFSDNKINNDPIISPSDNTPLESPPDPLLNDPTKPMTADELFKQSIDQWVNDPNVTGEKVYAAEKILAAYNRKATTIYLSYLFLDSLPDSIENLSSLKHLYLSRNKLSALPDTIGNLSSLTYLDLSANNLEALPATIGNLSSLTELNLSKNNLSALPDTIGNLSSLTELKLFHNKLSSLPDTIENLSSLTYLDLSANNLEALPATIGNLSSLKELNLSCNEDLSNLPLSLGNLLGLTYIDIGGTKIPEEIHEAILAQCRAARDKEASIKLPKKISTWQIFAKQKENNSDFLEALSIEQKHSIYEWLIRLERTRDFNRNQADLAHIVCSMLETLNTNETFKELFFIQVDENLACCEDRAAMSFNEIYTSWKIHTMPENASIKEKLELLIGVAKTEELRITISQNLQGKNETESVELYLYYEKKLKDKLTLVSAIKDMRYADIGYREWINEEALVKSVLENYLSRLVKHTVFEKLAMEDPKYAEERKSIIASAQTAQAALDEEVDIDSGDLITKSNALKQENDRRIEALSKAWAIKNSI